MGEILELEIKGEELILRPYGTQTLAVRLVPAQTLAQLQGAVALGGDAVEDA